MASRIDTGNGYTLYPEAFREHVLNAPWMVADMLERVERAKTFAEAIAPFAAGEHDHYRDHFHASAHRDGGTHHDRAQGTLTNDHDTAAAVEFGTGGEGRSTRKRPQGGDSPEHATLRKALDAAG